MSGSVWAIGGAAGRLLAGTRLAASFADWTAKRQEDGRWRITPGSAEPDPYWFEQGGSFRAVLLVGHGEVSGPATLLSRDPLVFEMEIR